MTIIEAIQKAENGALITNGFLKGGDCFLKYVGNGLFYEYKILGYGTCRYKYEVREFGMASILSTSWEVQENNFFNDTNKDDLVMMF